MAQDYSTTWITWEIIPLGGNWAFAVGIIEDGRGCRKVRIAKGKIRKDAQDGELPITQVQRLNIKPDDWTGKDGGRGLLDAVDSALAELVMDGVTE